MILEDEIKFLNMQKQAFHQCLAENIPISKKTLDATTK